VSEFQKKNIDKHFFETLYANKEDPWRILSDKIQIENSIIRLNIIQQWLGALKEKTLLDAGCGEGITTQYFTERARLTIGIDVSPTAAARAKKNNEKSQFVACDLEHLPFRNEVFDAVLCLEVLYLCEEPKKVIEELNRSLKFSGPFILSINNKLSLWRIIRRNFKSSAFTLFSSFELVNMLREHKFAIKAKKGIIYCIPPLVRSKKFRQHLLRPLAYSIPWFADFFLVIALKNGSSQQSRVATGG
jgi:SAM-dependent methyltransferase